MSLCVALLCFSCCCCRCRRALSCGAPTFCVRSVSVSPMVHHLLLHRLLARSFNSHFTYAAARGHCCGCLRSLGCCWLAGCLCFWLAAAGAPLSRLPFSLIQHWHTHTHTSSERQRVVAAATEEAAGPRSANLHSRARTRPPKRSLFFDETENDHHHRRRRHHNNWARSPTHSRRRPLRTEQSRKFSLVAKRERETGRAAQRRRHLQQRRRAADCERAPSAARSHTNAQIRKRAKEENDCHGRRRRRSRTRCGIALARGPRCRFAFSGAALLQLHFVDASPSSVCSPPPPTRTVAFASLEAAAAKNRSRSPNTSRRPVASSKPKHTQRHRHRLALGRIRSLARSHRKPTTTTTKSKQTHS